MSDASTEHVTVISGEVLPCGPSAPGEARRVVLDTLGEQLGSEAADTLELLVSEVVTNAVTHAGSSCELAVRLVAGTRVRVEISDSQASQPHMMAGGGAEDSQGRGLWLVDALAADWGVVRFSGAGKAVWFEVAR